MSCASSDSRRDPRDSEPDTSTGASNREDSGGDRHRRHELFHRQVHGSELPAQLERLAAQADVVIEARGTFCPEPVIRVQSHMRDMRAGETAMLLADDAGVELDIPAWCISTRNEYLGLLKEARFYRVFVRRS